MKIVDENNKRMIGPGENTDKMLECRLEAELCLRRRNCCNCRLMTDHIAMLNPSVAQVFGRDVYSSASFGAAKPAAQSYLRCLGQLGIGAAQTLFIDDSAANVTGAIDAGLQGYRFVSTEALAAELARRQLI